MGQKGLEGDVIIGETFKGLFPLELYIKHCRCGILFSVINVFISRIFFFRVEEFHLFITYSLVTSIQ